MNVEMIILAAGLGTRMKSEIPKVLHPVCGYPMLELLLECLDQIAGVTFNIVIGHKRELIKKMVDDLSRSGAIKAPVVFTTQEEQKGTGHAVKLALENKSSAPTVAVFNGDLPLFTSESFAEFYEAHRKNKSAASLMSTLLDNPAQYGRVLRKGKNFIGVVENKDASVQQKKIREINGGVYLFDRKFLEQAIPKLKSVNASGEFYLPDVFALALRQKKKIYAHCVSDASVLSGVNTMRELAEAQQILYRRTALKWMDDGVFIHKPGDTFIGPKAKLSAGCVIGPYTSIHGNSVINSGVQIGSHCELRNVVVGAGSQIKTGTVAENAQVGRDCTIGPMAHLRSGTKLLDQVRVGNFVEVKESQIGSHTNAAHLSYIGDAQIGSGVNLGCGFITCNFDGTVREGKRKHRTIIGDRVFVGSDSQVVAPIEIADGTYIASGSTVTDNVSERDSLVIARSRQVTKSGYAKKYRKS